MAPLPSWLKAVPFVGDVVNFASEYGAGRGAGLDPMASAKRAAVKASAGLAASVAQPADLLTIAPWATRSLGEVQKRRLEEAKTPTQRAMVVSHPNPLIKGSVLGSPQSAARLAGFLDYLNPEAWALEVADKLNPDLQGSYSLDPEQRAQEIKEEMLRKAAQKPQ